MLVGVALPPTVAAQLSDDASLAWLSVDSTVAQTKMTPAFDRDVTDYFVAAPSEGDMVTVNFLINHRSATLGWIGDDADPNLPGHQLSVTAGDTTSVSIRVDAEDEETYRWYGITVARASNQEMGWRVYDDVLVHDIVDDPRLPTHYLAGLWADDSRVFTTARRHVPNGLTDPNDPTSRPLIKLDQKLYAFNAADGLRRSSGEEFVLGGNPDGGIWSDGTTLWAMDFDGSLRAYSLLGGERETVEEYDDSVTVTALPLEDLSTDVTPNGYYDTSDVEAPRGIWSDGSTLWVVDNDQAKVFAFGLPGTPNCSSNGNYCRQLDKDFSLAADNDNPWGITAGKSTPDGEVDTWWVTNPHEDRTKDRKLFAYNRSDGSRNSDLDIDLSQLDIANGQQYYYGLAATETIMYVADFITGHIYSFSMPGVSGPIGPALVSSDATLSSLSLSNITFPAPPTIFTPEQTFYTVQVGNDVTSTTVTATPTHGAASYVVNKNGVYDDDRVIPLDEGTNTITVVVTAADGRTTKPYTVVVERLRLSDDATLSALTLSGVDPQDLGFSAATEDYRVDVASSSTSTTVTAIPNNGDATVEIDGVEGTVRSVDVLVGETEIEILVTAADSTTKTYTVTVTRERAKSDNAMLNDLRLMYGDEEAQLTPGFASDVYTYRTTVAHGVSSVLVKYELSDTNAEGVEMRIGGAKDNNGVVANEGVVTLQAGVVPSVDLLVGVNTLTVEVTAENGTDTHEYEVTITRSEASNVATLESLSLDPGELMRQGGAVGGFAPDVVLYVASVLHGDATTVLSLVKTNGTATVVVKHGGIVGQNDMVTGGTDVTGSVDATDSNTLNYDIPLPAPVGSQASDTVVTIQVTAQDNTTTNIYVVTVTRPVEPDSTDATLGVLTLTNPKNSRAVLDSEFSPSETRYDISVGNDVTQIVVVAKPTDPDADSVVLRLGEADLGSKAALADGVTVDLAEPNVANVLTIKVTAEDGNATETYTVVVTRSLPPLSGVATLDELVLKDVAQAELTLDPVFNRGDDPGQDPFETSVANGVTKVHVTARSTDSDATVEVMVGGTVDQQDGTITGETDANAEGFVPLAVGDNTVRVVVTAQNGTEKIYEVTVTRAVTPPSDDATLSSLTLDEATLNFMSDKLSYDVNVANGVTSATVRAVANSEAASLAVTLGSASAASDTDVKLTAPLAVGANVIEVVVTPEDQQDVTPEDQRTTKTYTITVNRAAPRRTPPPGNSNPGTSNTGGNSFNPGGGSSTTGGGTEADTSEDSSDGESDTSSPYTDAGDGGSAQEEAINALYGLGVLTGTECEDNRICPNDALSRWLAAVWLVRILDGEEPPAITESRFADVNASSMWEESMWFAPHVERLAELGVTVGCSVTAPARFCPDEGLSRAQVASWLARAFDLSSAASAGFTDTVDNTHEAYIDSVVAAGIMSGCSTNPSSFCPDTVVTRGGLALYVDRARKLSSDS